MAEFDVVVLGGGLSGTRAALRAVELGGKVCLVEKESIGRKGFLKRNVLLAAGSQKNRKESINWKEQLSSKEKLADEYSKNLENKLNQAGIVLVKGEGSLASQNEILVQEENTSHVIKGKSIILACGSEPSFSPTLPHEKNLIISIDEISKLEK